ncbi:MAG: putative PurR-regulated permease PerM [Crocinitomix sp.]|jgi:predicted PurR-regulated permease PerM
MNISDKTKAYLIGGTILVCLVILLHFVGEIILPFIFALFIAYLVNPIIVKIQKWIKNRNLALSSFLLFITALFVGIVFLFGDHIINDTKRLVNAVDSFVVQNEDEINDIKNSVSSFADEVYESEIVQSQIQASDTLTTEEQEKDLFSTLEQVYTFFSSSESTPNEPEKAPWNWFFMVIYTLMYTIVILYTYEYFEAKYDKYFSNKVPVNNGLMKVWKDFKSVFLAYFKQRTKIVLICMALFVISFSIMNLPGAIIIGIFAGLLCYAAQFHYLSLPIVAIGCWVLSIEHDMSFFLFFGIILAIYILVSILEETIFFEKIMKSVRGMNAAIMILAFAFWIFVFGSFIGTILALPLTQLILIYMDQFILFSAEKMSSDSSQES